MHLVNIFAIKIKYKNNTLIINKSGYPIMYLALTQKSGKRQLCVEKKWCIVILHYVCMSYI